jgi:hypothetical protein
MTYRVCLIKHNLKGESVEYLNAEEGSGRLGTEVRCSNGVEQQLRGYVPCNAVPWNMLFRLLLRICRCILGCHEGLAIPVNNRF